MTNLVQVLELMPGKSNPVLYAVRCRLHKTRRKAPALTPERILGLMSCSNNDCITPRCAKPLIKPPLKAYPIGYLFVNQLFDVASM